MKADTSKIKRLIRNAGMTQAEFADKFRITRVYLSHCLNGAKPMSNRLINEIAAYFGVDPAELYAPSEEPSIEVPEGETYVQCPYCHNMVGVRVETSRIKDPEDPFKD